MKLTTEQIDQFQAHGVVIVPGILTDADLAPVIAAIESWIDDRANAWLAEGRITDTHAGEGFDTRIASLYAQDKEFPRGIDLMEMRDPDIFSFMGNDNLLDAVECLVGPEITCNPIHHLRAKMPVRLTGEVMSYEQNVPWHQDVSVTWEEADHSNIVTCWLPLVDVTLENGCMHVLPDVFRCGYLEHISEGGTRIRPDLMPDIEPLVAACPKGGIVFMDKCTPHAGITNRTESVRWSMDLRYQPTGVPTGRPFHPDFIVRSAADPDSVYYAFDEWNRRWDEALEASAGYQAHRSIPIEERSPKS